MAGIGVVESLVGALKRIRSPWTRQQGLPSTGRGAKAETVGASSDVGAPSDEAPTVSAFAPLPVLRIYPSRRFGWLLHAYWH